MVEALVRVGAKRWLLILVDGHHKGDAPCLDVEAVMHYSADTPMLLFYDLVSGYVPAGLGATLNAG